MTTDDNFTIRNTLRIIAVAPILVIGIVSIILGIFMYFRCDADERDFNAKMQSIRTGQVSPETLTVIEKYISPSRHGNGYPHVILRGNRSPRVNLSTLREFYDSVALGSPVIGYYFPGGYFVPQSRGHDAGIAKWIFLGSGFVMGGMMFAYGFSQFRRPSVGLTQLAALIQARADTARRD